MQFLIQFHFRIFLISTSTQTGDLLSITTTSFRHIYTQTDNCNCITMPMFNTTECQSDTPYDYNTPIYTTTGCQSETHRDYNAPIINALPPPLPSTISHINTSDVYDSESLAKQLQLDFPTVFANKVTLQGTSAVMHHIHLINGYTRPYIYPVPYSYRDKVNTMLDEMLQAGILRPSASKYTAP